MIRTGGRFGLLLLGALLVTAGQYTLAVPRSVTTLADGHLGWAELPTGFMPAVFPPGVDAGLVTLLLGALFVALVIGGPPLVRRRTQPNPQLLSSQPRWRRAAFGCLGIACVLATIATQLSATSDPGTGTVILWLSALIVAGTGMGLCDRIRRTSFGNPFSRWEWPLLAMIVALDLLLVAHDLRDWRWAGTPDEADFFALAKSMAQGTWSGFLLSEHGVFSVFPLLGSYYQSVFMRLFGMNIFGWRLSSAAALAGSLPLLYLFTRELWNRCAAWMAAVFFGSAQLAVGFAHFGYLNVQVYPITTGSLAVLLWAHRRRSMLGYYLAGCITGLGFYTFQSARFVPVLVILLGWSVGALPIRKGDRRVTLALALGALLTAAPACAHPSDLVRSILRHTALTGGHPANLAPLATYIDAYLRSDHAVPTLVHHWLLSSVYGFWFTPAPPRQWNHFQWNPIIDPVCGAFVAVGLWMCVGGLFRRGNATFLLLAYLVSALVIGSTSEYDRPPLTRLLFLAPLSAMLAAGGLEGLLRRAAQTARRESAAWALGTVVVTTSVAWSTIALHKNISEHYHGFGDGTTSEVLRVVQDLPESCKVVYVQRWNALNGWVDGVLAEYGIADRFTYFRQVDQRTVSALAALQPPVVIFYDLERAADILLIRDLLAARFPGVEWQNSDAGRPWNVSYLYIPASRTLP